uniref:Uncharacterized protein n=1 Tax=Meloidogyne hapla TaxID=6305 RepID=A0A1I8BAI6_MELHA
MLRKFKLMLDKNIFNVTVNNRTKYTLQLKRKILIEIANNKIIQKLLPELEKLELNESIENYEENLLTSYWSELNLIGYKIELLNKNKEIRINNDNKLKELESGIIFIGNIISNLYFLELI